MSLINSAPLIHMLNQFRILWAMGGYGTGKTLGGFELVAALWETGRYRYVLSNCNSVWTDNPEKVVLRDGSFVDAIVVLDEGGLFMHLSSDADQFLLGLRKLNITIIVPSVLPPAQRIKALQMQRILNGGAFGIPLWLYEYRLALGSEREKAMFGLWNPAEMWGIYDTLDYPVDDCYLSEWFQYWMVTAKESHPAWCTWGAPPKSKRLARAKRTDSGLDELRGQLEELSDAQGEISDTISILTLEKSKQGRRRRT